MSSVCGVRRPARNKGQESAHNKLATVSAQSWEKASSTSSASRRLFGDISSSGWKTHVVLASSATIGRFNQSKCLCLVGEENWWRGPTRVFADCSTADFADRLANAASIGVEETEIVCAVEPADS